MREYRTRLISDVVTGKFDVRNVKCEEVKEGKGSQSEADYLTKCSIACKEARETLYWLKLLSASETLSGQPAFRTHNEM